MTEKHNRITKYNPEVKEDRQKEKGGEERESERGGGVLSMVKQKNLLYLMPKRILAAIDSRKEGSRGQYCEGNRSWCQKNHTR